MDFYYIKINFFTQGQNTQGNWGSWSAWSECDAKCPKTSGKLMRTRKCDNPAPSDGGMMCAGKMKEEKSCYINCTSKINESCSKTTLPL